MMPTRQVHVRARPRRRGAAAGERAPLRHAIDGRQQRQPLRLEPRVGGVRLVVVRVRTRQLAEGGVPASGHARRDARGREAAWPAHARSRRLSQPGRRAPVCDAEQAVEGGPAARGGDEAAANEGVDAVAACRGTGRRVTLGRGPPCPRCYFPSRRTFPVGELAALPERALASVWAGRPPVTGRSQP